MLENLISQEMITVKVVLISSNVTFILLYYCFRVHKVAISELELTCTWGASKTSGSVSLEGMYLEGASFDGTSLIANTADSSDVMAAPLLSVQWIPKVSTSSESAFLLQLRKLQAFLK